MHATHKHTNNKWTIITINQTCMLLTSILTISGLYNHMHATHKINKTCMHAHKHTNNKWTIITINQTCMLLTSILTISGL